MWNLWPQIYDSASPRNPPAFLLSIHAPALWNYCLITSLPSSNLKCLLPHPNSFSWLPWLLYPLKKSCQMITFSLFHHKSTNLSSLYPYTHILLFTPVPVGELSLALLKSSSLICMPPLLMHSKSLLTFLLHQLIDCSHQHTNVLKYSHLRENASLIKSPSPAVTLYRKTPQNVCFYYFLSWYIYF